MSKNEKQVLMTFAIEKRKVNLLLQSKNEKQTIFCNGETKAKQTSAIKYTERKKKRRVEFFPSYFNHFLRCLL